MNRPGASPDGLPPLRDVIKAFDLKAKKSLGQNFLLDFNITRRIANLAGPLNGVTVIEVGPGPGGLTRALLMEGAHHVVAIERDARCLPALEDIANHTGSKLTVHNSDALGFDWVNQAANLPGPKVIAANLPYGVATQLLVQWLHTEPWPPWFQRMVLMFQKEVAERIVAKPGSKAYGRLAVLTQWRARPEIVMTLQPDVFTPPPKVASAIVVFHPLTATGQNPRTESLGKVTAAAFGQRRKMLRASLRTLVPNPIDLLEAAGLGSTIRAEDVSVHEFVRLALVFEKSNAGR
ncbi:MAG: 16S rRNA (adenine(1518)-N(6)/adenine(1519)-N(6))-dimethyltransferase RsmA [Alphaproteobacteria bacterium]|nr:16S rRNA (adenine(1518)-N(6)/adenine(1519)-N(6))-dimethyltransferase RsmA [Alphaproteobacteria bacterium]